MDQALQQPQVASSPKALAKQVFAEAYVSLGRLMMTLFLMKQLEALEVKEWVVVEELGCFGICHSKCFLEEMKSWSLQAMVEREDLSHSRVWVVEHQEIDESDHEKDSERNDGGDDDDLDQNDHDDGDVDVNDVSDQFLHLNTL